MPRPAREVGRVVFCRPPGAEWYANGKMFPDFFLPPFCTVMARHGFGSYFVDSAEALARAVGRNTAVIFVYNEELHNPARVAERALLEGDAYRHACADAVVFNAPAQGRMLGDKRATSARLAALGVGVPPEVPATAGAVDVPVFSRALSGSKQGYAMVPPGAPLDPDRHNTRLIDTRFAHDGRQWYSAMRLMGVGRQVIHMSARARDADEGDASVHATDMPDDLALVGAAHAALIAGREAELAALGARIADALGPGFFHHDVMRERGTGALYVSEVGYKFHHMGSTRRRLAHMPAEVTGVDHSFVRTAEWGRRAARAFVAEARRLGLWIPEPARGR